MTKKYDDYINREIKKFTDEMIKDYEKSNLIKSFCTLTDFDKKHKEKEFIQIGERINLPKEFFIKEEGVQKDNTMIASDFIRSLINGEKYFVLKEILNSDKIESVKISSFNLKKLTEVISKFNNPTDIFFPIEKFHNRVYSFGYEKPDSLRFESGKGPILSINGKEVNIHWILSRLEINKIIVTNKKELKIIQKKFEDAEKITGINSIKEFEDLSKNQKLMLYLCEKDKDKDKFDFTFRTVISKPELGENSALVIEVEE